MRRHAAHVIAPSALLAVAAAAVLIISGNTGSHHHRHHGPARSLVRSRRHGAPRARQPSPPRFYTVRSGDSLSAIAARTGISLPQLIGLNAQLMPPYSLHTGQRLRLRR